MEPGTLTHEAIASWEAHAQSWDTSMGDDGNEYFSALELPALKRMIMGPTGGSALDLAMANSLARWLAQEGFSVIATDGATAILEQAQTRTALWREEGKIAKGQEISFHLLDMTSTDHWAQFIASSHQTQDGFDVIVMNIAITDIADLQPLAATLARLLKQDGWFALLDIKPPRAWITSFSL